MSALPGLGPLIGRPRIVTTYYDLHSQQLSSQRLLLAGSHLVTVSNARQRELMDNYCRGFKKKRPEVEILPVPAFRDSEFANSRSSIDDAVGSIGDPAEHLRDFLDQSNQLIFIPGDLDRHPDLMGLLRVLADLLTEQESVSVLFGGGWGEIFPVERKRLMAILEERGLGARVFISGPISEDIELFCLERSLAVFLASLTRESLSLTRLLRTVLMSASAIPIMSKSQAAIDSLPWQSNISESNHHTSPGQAILTDDSPLAWKNALTLALTSPELVRKIREELPEFARLQTLDQPGNVMSRLYARLLDQPN
jgi:glycosyltransferase involved in cell wall biosynthesis